MSHGSLHLSLHTIGMSDLRTVKNLIVKSVTSSRLFYLLEV